MCLDLKNFYLTAALDYYEYMKILLALFPKWIKKQYNLDTNARDVFVFLEIQQAVWGLPQAGILANKLLQKWLKPHGYYECVNTPVLWRHATRPITFSLVVDNFGVKYAGKEHADHLISCLKKGNIQTYQRLGQGLILRPSQKPLLDLQNLQCFPADLVYSRLTYMCMCNVYLI